MSTAQVVKKVNNPVQKAQDSQIKAIQNQIEGVRKHMLSITLSKDLSPEEKKVKLKVLQGKVDVLSKRIIARQNIIMKNESEVVYNKGKDDLKNDKNKELEHTLGTASSLVQNKESFSQILHKKTLDL